MTTATAAPTAPVKARAVRKSTKLQGLQVFMENRLAVFGVCLILILMAFSFIGPLFYVTDQIHTDPLNSALPPSAEHPLGTDTVGYDQLGRLMKGGQTSIIVGLFAGIFATTIGTLYGAIAGFVGGWVDAIMMRIVDALMSVPVLFLFMLIATMIPPTVPVLIIIMSALSWLGTSRLIRGEALSLRTREYVIAMRGMGGSMPRAIRTHIVRNTIGTVIVNATFQVADAVLYVAYLSFLGLGAQPPATDWGAMLSNSQSQVYSGNWWLLYPPGVLIILLVLSFNFIGDGLRDAFEVRLRKR
ncbi:ABC transporter permease [Actinomyces sp. oral taxon 180]|uniref:ABC transporter permease n=1 Tax=Actinomyces sp. oral taxon 180 TaxID=651609 RepID=UPI0001F1048C|nr:ABC transporter permease [Actinomyces sp. oral taxon 180]EFU60199.1 oligopeptide ABC superfamily ATP binding cassette transporter, membrane protein [Actinomyces sp. oral taxon 180 str. F0310]